MAEPDRITSERWATIARFPGYEFSDSGRVRSYWKRGGGTGDRVDEPCILKPGVSARGYLVIRIYDADRVHRMCQVHRLVLEAFVGPCPRGHEACHMDGDRLNPKLDNLYWGTRKDNVQDTRRHGRVANMVIPLDRHREIVALYDRGWKQAEIAREFSVKQAAISVILIREGRRTQRPRFTEEEIARIVELRSQGCPRRKVAEMFNATVKSIDDVLYRRFGSSRAGLLSDAVSH